MRFKKIKNIFKDGGKKNCVGKTSDGACPTKPDLYKKVKSKVKKDYGDDYPSAYASAAIVKRYKKKGGDYKK